MLSVCCTWVCHIRPWQYNLASHGRSSHIFKEDLQETTDVLRSLWDSVQSSPVNTKERLCFYCRKSFQLSLGNGFSSRFTKEFLNTRPTDRISACTWNDSAWECEPAGSDLTAVLNPYLGTRLAHWEPQSVSGSCGCHGGCCLDYTARSLLDPVLKLKPSRQQCTCPACPPVCSSISGCARHSAYS